MTQTPNKPASQAAATAETQARIAAKTVKTAAAKTSEAIPGLDMEVPEAVRSMAETAVARGREAYDTAKGAMEETVETLERSLDKAGQGAAALNRKAIDIARANVNSSFDLAKDLAAAKNLAEIVELQAAFARKQFETFVAQAEEMRALSSKVASDSAEPFKAHVSRSLNMLKRAS